MPCQFEPNSLSMPCTNNHDGMYRTTKRQTAQDAVAKAKLKAESSRELRETKTASATLAKAACSGSYPSTGKPQDRWTLWLIMAVFAFLLATLIITEPLLPIKFAPSLGLIMACIMCSVYLLYSYASRLRFHMLQICSTLDRVLLRMHSPLILNMLKAILRYTFGGPVIALIIMLSHSIPWAGTMPLAVVCCPPSRKACACLPQRTSQ